MHKICASNRLQVIKSVIAEKKVFRKGINYFDRLIQKLYKLNSFINIQLTINEFMKLTTTLIILWVGSSMIIKNELSLGELLMR
jgi:ABC-type bacteriocin/lantibiotic exporter with double-glycine peptidase domain